MCDLSGELTATNHCPVFPEVRGRLAISKQATQTFDVERFNLR